MMDLLQIYIDKFLKDNKAKSYNIDFVAIDTDIDLQDDEVLFITNYAQTLFSYHSIDEYFDSSKGFRITQNLGFIKIVSGYPNLNGVKIKITEFEPEPECIIITKK